MQLGLLPDTLNFLQDVSVETRELKAARWKNGNDANQGSGTQQDGG
jgi:hypothetical protein